MEESHMNNRSLAVVCLAGVMCFCLGGLVGWIAGSAVKPQPLGPIDSAVVTTRKFKVAKVLDGNSFEVIYDGEPTVARIAGLSAPPPDDPEGIAAAAELSSYLEGRTVSLVFPKSRKRDERGRLVVQAFLGDEDVVDVGKKIIAANPARAAME
jgi:endonuclease YncB( thermonuclease family)